MPVVAVIQARIGSTRLPGKVLKHIGDRTMLARVVNRSKQATTLQKIVVATTVKLVDDAIAEECRRLDVDVFRGSEEDVLDRYVQAARCHEAEIVVRITADCPLLDFRVIDRAVKLFNDNLPDYASTTIERTFPRGMDVEVMSFDALTRAWQEATLPFERVHVTPYIYRNPALFNLLSVTMSEDHSGHRWTVDTLEDLELVRALYDRFDNDDFSLEQILQVLADEPELAAINRHIKQKTLEEG